MIAFVSSENIGCEVLLGENGVKMDAIGIGILDTIFVIEQMVMDVKGEGFNVEVKAAADKALKKERK